MLTVRIQTGGGALGKPLQGQVGPKRLQEVVDYQLGCGQQRRHLHKRHCGLEVGREAHDAVVRGEGPRLGLDNKEATLLGKNLRWAWVPHLVGNEADVHGCSG